MTTTTRRPMRKSAIRWGVGALGVAAGAYGAYAAATYLRYGRTRANADAIDPMLDRFMPMYDVVERHRVRVDAPAEVTLAAAREMDLFQTPLVRAIFKARQLVLGSTADDQVRPRGLLASVESLGWTVLAEEPGREIVVGAVTQPWEPNPTFRPVPADAFAGFAEPNYVKIIWNLRADPLETTASVFRTETRAVATDVEARAKFRTYWAFLSPGISLIRRASLQPLRAEAERRARAGAYV